MRERQKQEPRLPMIADDAAVRDLRMQLAIMRDAGGRLVKLCYGQEGDAALQCCTTYDHWCTVMGELSNICNPNIPAAEKLLLLPSVVESATAIEPEQAAERSILIQGAAARMVPVSEKMRYDFDNRLAFTMRVLRACRLFNWEFVAKVPFLALEAEMEHIVYLPWCSKAALCGVDSEVLKKYKSRADAQALVPVADGAKPLDHWCFWQMNMLELPIWSRSAEDVVLITPSSCTVERVFSLLSQGLGDNQRSALEDYITASVMIRYNTIWRSK
jgi:hypothetical protein